MHWRQNTAVIKMQIQVGGVGAEIIHSPHPSAVKQHQTLQQLNRRFNVRLHKHEILLSVTRMKLSPGVSARHPRASEGAGGTKRDQILFCAKLLKITHNALLLTPLLCSFQVGLKWTVLEDYKHSQTPISSFNTSFICSHLNSVNGDKKTTFNTEMKNSLINKVHNAPHG